ncbi:MAG: hypothetical protein KF745_14080 [Phycisphaeraceae bacterium]|nr:hypothetical protein [Phycisphaeraceae bacterium]
MKQYIAQQADIATLLGYADTPELHKSRWVSIIDEFPTQQRNTLALDTPVDYDETLFGYDGPEANKPGQLSRRVVEMNAAGFVLRERRWDFDPSGSVMSGGGLGEQYIYKEARPYFQAKGVEDGVLDLQPLSLQKELLLIEHRSVGWSAAELDNKEDVDGLVEFRSYSLVDDGLAEGKRRVELDGVGIQRGADSLAAASSRMYSGKRLQIHNNSTSINAETEISLAFVDPVLQTQFDAITAPPTLTLSTLAGYAAGNIKVTATITHRAIEAPIDQPDLPARERAVLTRTVIGTPRKQRPGGDWYYPIEKEWYDDKGNPEWSATGLVRDPFNPIASSPADQLESLIFTYFARQSMGGFGDGQADYTVLDASPGSHGLSVSGSTVMVPSYPDSLARMPASGAFNYVTSFDYDRYGLCDTQHANGLRWARRVIVVPKEALLADLTEDQIEDLPEFIARQYIFNDLYDPDQDGIHTSESIGEVKDYRGPDPLMVSPLLSRRVEFTSSIDLSALSDSSPSFQRLAAVRVGIDSSGHVRRADMLEWTPTGWMALGSKWINDLGEVYREMDLDATITRITRSSIGQNLRRYVGTKDEGWVYPGPPEAPLGYNMALLERYDYGSGSHDAWLPTVSRRYTDNPAWSRDHYGVAPSPDPDGIATVTQYDWRMRPVRTDSYSRGDPGQSGTIRESTTLTYLDHSNRPRLTVTFGRGNIAGITGALDPVELGDADDVIPSPESFFTSTMRPISISSMSYDPDGTMTERRTYDTAWNQTGTLPFHTDYHYSGKGGQEVFTQTPSQGVQLTVQDGVGRVASSITVAPGVSGVDPYAYQLSRTDYVYDAFGNTIETARWERTSPTGDELTTSNAVRTRTLNWYDLKKRLIATADLGAEDGQGSYVNGTPLARGDCPELDTQTGEIDPHGLPADVPISIYVYDKKGNQEYVANRNNPGHATTATASVTHSEYSNLGRLTRKTENCFDSDASMRRITEYAHSIGRLTHIKAYRDAPTSPSDADVTNVTYGADIVNQDFSRVSQNNSLIGRMLLPRGAGSDDPIYEQHADIVLRYTFSGQVAERIDRRGLAFRYRYDDQDRLASVEVGHYDEPDGEGTFAAGYPSSMTPSSGSPVDRIGYTAYAYDANGRLADIIAYENRSAATPPVQPEAPIAHTRYVYDHRGNLVADYQSHGWMIPEPPVGVPMTGYAWDYEPTGTAPGQTGHLRLASIDYPRPVDVVEPLRTVTLGYGSSNSIDSLLSRLATITTTLDGASPSEIAAFTYSGTGRRASMSLGGSAITQAFTGTGVVGLPGLDKFGRLRDLHYTNSASATLFRGEYTYDTAGSRVTAKITQVDAPGPSGGRNNTQSQLNAYDALDRLIGTQVGAVAFAGNGTPSIASGTLLCDDAWTLDLLGNWTGVRDTEGAVVTPGRETLLAGGSSAADAVTHAVNPQNQVTGITRTLGSTTTQANTRHDAAGNLTFDGTYFYQYDAWGRLLQINRAHEETGSVGGEGGGGNYLNGGEPGDPEEPPTVVLVVDQLIKHYTYDGLGRLIRTQSPFPDADTAAAGNLRSERFYYDGIRRLQEVVTDPLISLKGAELSQNLELQQMAAAGAPEALEVDGDATPITFEQMQMNAFGGGGGAAPLLMTVLAREYIWGPGDAAPGVDELLVQYGSEGLGANQVSNRTKPWYVLQDAGGDVAAVAEVPLGSQGTPQPAAVAGQWTYDAYGAALTADVFAGFPEVHCGHKALFFDRLDVGVADGDGSENARLEPYAHLVVHMRNRVYSPSLGRFFQRDPNATAAVLIEASVYHGRGLGAIAAAFSMEEMYGDGGSLYQYLRSNPGVHSDSLGLLVGYDDAVMWFVGGMRGGMEEMLGQYADNMSADVEWAADWEMGDDWHTRGDNQWVKLSFAMGFYRGMMQQVRESFFMDEIEAAGDWLMSSRYSRGGSAAKRALKMASTARELGNAVIHETYEIAKAARRAGGVEAHSHHVVELQMKGSFRTGLKGTGPALNLGSRFHLSEMRKRFNRASSGMDIKNLKTADAKEIIKKVYHDAPRVRNAAWKWLDGR